MISLQCPLHIRIRQNNGDNKFGDSGEGDIRPLPEWASNLVHLGCWLLESYDDSRKKTVIIWVPTRICASAFIALGIMTASAKRGLVPLTYQEFLNLPLGKKVRVWDKDNRGRYRALDSTILPGKGDAVRCLGAKGKGKRLIYPDSFNTYQLYAIDSISKRQQSLRENTQRFFSSLVGKEDGLWSFVSKIEALIITNRKLWNIEIDNIDIFLNSYTDNIYVEFTEALQSNSDSTNRATRILLSSPGDDQPNIPNSSPVILDGPNAFMSHEDFPNNDVVVVIEESEYEYSMEHTIWELLDQRDELLDIDNPSTNIKVLAFNCERGHNADELL